MEGGERRRETGEQGQNKPGRPACLRAPPAPPPAPAHHATRPPTPQCGTKGVAAGSGGRGIGRAAGRPARVSLLCGQRAFVPFRSPHAHPCPPASSIHTQVESAVNEAVRARPDEPLSFLVRCVCGRIDARENKQRRATQTREGGAGAGPASAWPHALARALRTDQMGGWRRRGGGGGGRERGAQGSAHGWSADGQRSERSPHTPSPPSPQADTFQKMAPAAITKVVGRQVIDSR